MCIWAVAEADRKCEFCSYRGGCEKYPLGNGLDRRAKSWLIAMNKLIGEDVRKETRRKRLLWGRNFLAYKARTEGLSLSQIGSLIKRNHATALFAARRGEYAITNPQMYSDIVGLWSDFQEILSSKNL